MRQNGRKTPLGLVSGVFLCFVTLGCDSSSRVAARPAEECGVLFLGTSLTAGYGLDSSEAFPDLLRVRLVAAGAGFDVRNAGISGEVASELLDRLADELAVAPQPGLVVVETGANDMLRGLSPSSYATTLSAILDEISVTLPDASVLLLRVSVGAAGFLPGTSARAAVMDSLSEIASRRDILIVDDILDGVRFRSGMLLPDGIHPSVAGARVVADNVWPSMAEALSDRGCRIP